MNKKILKQIEYCRKQQGMSLKELSDKTGISKTYLSHLENGKKNNPSLDVLERIAGALKLEIVFLIK